MTQTIPVPLHNLSSMLLALAQWAAHSTADDGRDMPPGDPFDRILEWLLEEKHYSQAQYLIGAYAHELRRLSPTGVLRPAFTAEILPQMRINFSSLDTKGEKEFLDDLRAYVVADYGDLESA